MSHHDQDSCRLRYNAKYLKQALQWLLSRVVWSSISFRQDCTWTPLHLVPTALLWTWSDEQTLGERFFAARRLAAHLYRPQQEFAASSQAFLKLLVRWTSPLMSLLQAALRERIEVACAASWQICGFVVQGRRISGIVRYLARWRRIEALPWNDSRVFQLLMI